MDILDEIDAAIQEKKSKWKYTPMREKNETDAIIDELLREFPSGGYEENSRVQQPSRTDMPVNEDRQPEIEQEYNEIEPYVYNEEQLERQQYENNIYADTADPSEAYKEQEYYDNIPAENYTEPEDYDNAPEEDYAEPAVYDNAPAEDYEEPAAYDNSSEENYAEPADYDNMPADYQEPEISDDIQSEEYEETEVQTESDGESLPEENDGSEEYNEYISHKYTNTKYEAEDETALYNDDEYDGEDDDDDFEEFQEEMPEESGRKKYTNKDFNNFMDSANDGEKGDIPKFSLSSAILTILKIIALAAFGALSVVGIINTVSIGVDKYNKAKGKPGSDLKEELQSVIYPVVVTETADFAGASQLTSEQLVNIAVWEVVINGNKSVFKDKDTGEYYLPQEQMIYIIEKLFGEETGFKHTDSGIGDKKIVYDAKNKQYVLPENTDLYTMRPVVTDVAQTGDVFAVYADCYSSSPSWSSVKSDEPVKRVVVTMKKTADYYNITDMKTIPLN